jgi:hypothetical protein
VRPGNLDQGEARSHAHGPEISFTSDTHGREIGDGLSRMISIPSRLAREATLKAIITMVGGNVGTGEAIIGDSDRRTARELGIVRVSTNIAQINKD